ncbi:MAG: hypothetical protein BMS9Abin26_0881 [Gammaproteobacteria bacterium]|nr:MAG: hypothetical protein BMS9Abin26_0881 [Gammaproteobacteria bacterium]
MQVPMPFTRTRRRFLKFTLLLGSALTSTLGHTLERLQQGASRPLINKDIPVKALTAYIDTLIPRDATAGALDLGIPALILQSLQSRPKHRALVARGCRWLDAQARLLGSTDFASLPEASRGRIVGNAVSSKALSLPHEFFRFSRDLVMKEFYANAESWRPLHYPGPPQPRGFRDYQQPPTIKHPS